MKILFTILLLLVIAMFWYYQVGTDNDDIYSNDTVVFNPKECSYTIEGKPVLLKNGYAEQVMPNTTSKVMTKYFGNEIVTDLDNNRDNDTAFILTQDKGGSGIFYYLATALNMNGKCIGTNAILLGDRIAPQTTNYIDGEIVVNYADRVKDEPMTTQPSIGVSRYFEIVDSNLVEIIK